MKINTYCLYFVKILAAFISSQCFPSLTSSSIIAIKSTIAIESFNYQFKKKKKRERIYKNIYNTDHNFQFIYTYGFQ